MKEKHMMRLSKKGSILIAMIFVIILTLTAASYIMMMGGRSAFTTNQLKRAQAVNYAEAALYETFNRFRTGQWNPAQNDIIFNNRPQKYVYFDNPPFNRVPVRITKSGRPPSCQVSAEVNYDDVGM
jgi:Tfp pilus assembly protein PilX